MRFQVRELMDSLPAYPMAEACARTKDDKVPCPDKTKPPCPDRTQPECGRTKDDRPQCPHKTQPDCGRTKDLLGARVEGRGLGETRDALVLLRVQLRQTLERAAI